MVKQTRNYSLQTITWLGDKIVDWCRVDETYSPSGDTAQSGKYYLAYSFDSAIQTLLIISNNFLFHPPALCTDGITGLTQSAQWRSTHPCCYAFWLSGSGWR